MTARRAALAMSTSMALAAACRPTGDDAAGRNRLSVFVSIPPQAYLVERIGGPRVEVDVLIAPGQSPHTFQPTPRQVARLAKARMYFTIGLPFEQSIISGMRDSARELEVVDSTAGIERRRMEPGAHNDHDGHAAAEPSAAARDPHVWLDPRLAAVMARNIHAALRRAAPAHATEFDAKLDALERDLAALHKRLREKLAPFRGREILVFHPACGYFTDAYGLKQVSVEVEGKTPGPRQLAELIAHAKANGIRVVFAQPQFSSQSAAAVAAEVGGELVSIDPLARDYITSMEAMADAVARAFQRPPE